MTHQFEKYLQLGEKTYFNRLGKVVKIVGLTIESDGPKSSIGDLCYIYNNYNNLQNYYYNYYS